LLTRAGIDFERLAHEGISHKIFRESVLANGGLFHPSCHWIGFHTDHDFAYLLALLSGEDLPTDVPDFFYSLGTYVSTFHDLKVISERCADLQRGSLNKLAEQLCVSRDEGSIQHTAGSDSKLTARCFFALTGRESILEECENMIYTFHYDQLQAREEQQTLLAIAR